MLSGVSRLWPRCLNAHLDRLESIFPSFSSVFLGTVKRGSYVSFRDGIAFDSNT